MKNRLLVGPAVLVIGLLVSASSASAALTYFDAQIVDIASGKTTVPKNTVMCAPNNNCAETAFTALPLGPGGEGPPATTDPSGNWTKDGANTADSGTDGLWNQRNNAAFGNPDASGNGTVYEARGLFSGTNNEDPPVLKTTINVPQVDQGTTKGVYAMFWGDMGGGWQLAACLDCVEDEKMPLYTAGQTPTGYVFRVYDVGAGNPDMITYYMEMNGTTTTDVGSRRLYAAWLGNVELGPTLTAYVGDGPAPTPGDGSHNFRAWYDGIAYGDVQDLAPLPCGVPEPASVALCGLALAGFGLMRRRSR
jgi:hypothetical protein